VFGNQSRPFLPKKQVVGDGRSLDGKKDFAESAAMKV
jgi:hypothetical protein